MQCHIQEITISVASDPSGCYLFGGTKSGRIYCWEIASGNLVLSFQGHFKAITIATLTACGSFLITSSLDGMIRMWDVIALVSAYSPDGSNRQQKSGATNITPYRSWSPHTLAVTGLRIIGANTVCASPIRVLTCSMNRTLCLYDISASKQCFVIHLLENAECITTNPLGDTAFVGGSSGSIHIVSLAQTSFVLSSIHSKGQVSSLSQQQNNGSSSAKVNGDSNTLDGHTRRVTTLAFSMDNCTLVSGSDDGSVRVWDTWSRQCIREFKPLNKSGVTGLMVSVYYLLFVSHLQFILRSLLILLQYCFL